MGRSKLTSDHQQTNENAVERAPIRPFPCEITRFRKIRRCIDDDQLLSFCYSDPVAAFVVWFDFLKF